MHTGVVEDDGGQLVGLAVEESEAPAEATRPALLAEIGDAFDTWHA